MLKEGKETSLLKGEFDIRCCEPVMTYILTLEDQGMVLAQERIV